MQYDLIIQNGTVIDGSGLPRFRADVGIIDGKVASIGRIRGESAKETVDRRGPRGSLPVLSTATPIWTPRCPGTPLGTCSCWHGITSVIMGKLRLFRSRRAKRAKRTWSCATWSAPKTSRPEAMNAGINWTWETFSRVPGTALRRLPKGIKLRAPTWVTRRYGPISWASGRFTEESHRERPGTHEAAGARGHSGRGDGLYHLADAQPPDASNVSRWPAAWRPGRKSASWSG